MHLSDWYPMGLSNHLSNNFLQMLFIHESTLAALELTVLGYKGVILGG